MNRVENIIHQALIDAMGENPSNDVLEEIAQCAISILGGLMCRLGISKATAPTPDNMMIIVQAMPKKTYEDANKVAEKILAKSTHLVPNTPKSKVH